MSHVSMAIASCTANIDMSVEMISHSRLENQTLSKAFDNNTVLQLNNNNGFRKGVNIKVPLPMVDDILGSNSDKDHEDRWCFWVIIGIIGAFFIVGVYFTIRGFVGYPKLRGQKESDETDWQLYGQMGRKFSSEYFQSIHETRGNTINSDIIQNRDILIQRCGILSPGNTLGAMMPASISEQASILREQVVMQKVNPRMMKAVSELML